MEVEYDDDGNYKIKIILIGEAGVGKTNLINIVQNKDFSPNELSTPNCSFFMSEMTVQNIKFNVYLWDTIGQEKLKAQTKIFFKNSKIVVLVYDITQRESFTKLDEWYNQVKDSLGTNIVIGVLGNKKDLFINEDVKEEEAQEYAEKIGAKWALTSAKTERPSFITYLEDLIKIYITKANIKPKDNPGEKNEEIVKESSLKLQNTKTKKATLDLAIRLCSKYYPDTFRFWQDLLDEANKLLDSNRFNKYCNDVLKLDPQAVAEHLVVEGKATMNKVLKDGLENYGEKARMFSERLYSDDKRRLYVSKKDDAKTESPIVAEIHGE